MRKALILLLIFFIMLPATGWAQMRNNRLFKVDPAGLAFRELRVSVEHRLWKEFFWYLSPYAFHQNWLSRDNERYGRPDHPQKYYALGARAGVRKYMSSNLDSPEGIFLHAMISGRHTWLHNFSDGLDLTSKHRYGNLGVGFMVGYQRLYGPGFVPRKNFAYGVMAGMEFSPFYFYQGGLELDDLTRSWYQFPFLPSGFSRFRIYLGVELGFAFLQKRLHW